MSVFRPPEALASGQIEAIFQVWPLSQAQFSLRPEKKAAMWAESLTMQSVYRSRLRASEAVV